MVPALVTDSLRSPTGRQLVASAVAFALAPALRSFVVRWIRRNPAPGAADRLTWHGHARSLGFDLQPRSTAHPKKADEVWLRLRVPTPARDRGRVEQEIVRGFLEGVPATAEET